MTILELWTGGFLAQFGEDGAISYQIVPFFAGLILAAIVIPYLLGSINSAIIISRILYRDDVRRHGSGNAGMTNMLRTYGKGAAGLTLLGDLSKTVLAVLCGAFTLGASLGGWVACLFCMLGHIFPIFYKFRGGKGVLCAAVGILILSPFAFSFSFLVFVILVACTRYVSLGSVVAGLMLPLFINSYNQIFQTGGINGLVSVLMALLILWCHRANLKRISNHEESKLSFGKKKD